MKKAVYIAIGMNMAGIKEVLGMWVGENESAKYWLSILPKTEIQQCIIHQIRNTTRFVSYKGIKVLMAGLKRVYAAVDDSLLKMLYLAIMDITRKWTGKRRDWGIIHSQLEVFFADRLPD